MSEIRGASKEAVGEALFSQVENQGIALAQTLADSLTNHLYYYQMDFIRDLARSARNQHGVVYVYVHEPSGVIVHDGTATMESYGLNLNDEPLRQISETKKVLTWVTGRAKAGSGRQSAAEGPLDPQLIHVAAPIMLGPDIIGGVRVGFSLKDFIAEITAAQARLSKISDAGTENLLLTAAVATLVLIALGTLLADQLGRRLSRPIETLADVTAEIGKGRFDVDIPIQRSDEIGDLAVSVKRMASERKRAEEALHESEERLEVAIDSLSDGFSFYDADGNLVLCNQKQRDFFPHLADLYRPGVGREEIIRHHAAVIHEKDPAFDVEGYLDKRLKLIATPRTDIEYRLTDGRWVAMRERAVAGGGLVSIRTDITERKRAEETLRQAKETAEFANRSKTEFLANMSHELRTPLNSIIGFSDLLKDGVFGPIGNPKYKGYAGDINESGIHLLEVIGDILDVSRIEIGELDLAEDKVDIGETVETCMTMVRERSHKAKVSLTSKMPDGLPRLHADQRRVKQILLNLLTNAIKFTPAEGSVVLEAGLDEGGAIVLEIRDTGIGIAPEEIPKVLEPFAQVGDVMTRGHEGTGLGLSLAKSLAEMHGGTLSIDSRLGKGTRVSVSFPGHRTVASG